MGGGQLITTVAGLMRDAQIQQEQQKFTGHIDRVAGASEYEFSSDRQLKSGL